MSYLCRLRSFHLLYAIAWPFFCLSIINILLFPFSPDNRRKQQSGKTMWRWTGWRRTAFSSCIPKESSAAEPRSVAYGARHLLAATSLACESRDLRNRRDNRWVQFNKLKAETRVDLIIHIVTETVWKLNKMNEISRTAWLSRNFWEISISVSFKFQQKILR